MAPFFKGLSDHESDWTDEELIAAVKAELGANDPEEKGKGKEGMDSPVSSTPNIDHLTVPIASRSRSHSYTSDTSSKSSGSQQQASSSNPAARLRSKTLSGSSQLSSIAIPATSSLAPGEAVIPGREVDGRHVYAVLYKEAVECPICFLYYPPWLNRTRCCDQEICSECFVQIKRADPHLPDHHDTPNGANADSSSGITGNAELLTSEPASCPFCKETDFGITYSPPPFRLGLVLQSSQASPPASSPASSPASPSTPSKRRHHQLPHNAPQVITIDQIRPDWSMKLAHARAVAARRAAAATALHTAAFLMNTTSSSGPSSLSNLTSSSRRILRRVDPGTSTTPSPGNSGSGTPREGRASPAPGGASSASSSQRAGTGEQIITPAGLALLGISPPRQTPGQPQQVVRARMEDLEELMIMEAIRLSLAEEEERKKREAEEGASAGGGAGGEGSAAAGSGGRSGST